MTKDLRFWKFKVEVPGFGGVLMFCGLGFGVEGS